METNSSDIPILIGSFTAIFLALGVVLLLFYFLFKQKQKTHQLKIAALNEQLLKTEIEIQEQTLKNVSQEIHDNIGQVLSLAKLNLGIIGKFDPGQDDQKLLATKELISKAINDLRDLARSMHGEKIAEIGLQNAVDNELKILQNTGQFQTHLKVEGIPYKLNPHAQMILFRIMQEALHNELKHSKAKNIYVDFTYSPLEFILLLKDDGVGFNMEKLHSSETGIGLKSMKNRASLIGGEFSINSSENNGTSIIIKVPKDKTL